MGIDHSSVLWVGTLEWTIPMSLYIYIYTCNYRIKFDIGDVAFVCAMFHEREILVHVAHLPAGHPLLHLIHLTMGTSRTKHVNIVVHIPNQSQITNHMVVKSIPTIFP